MDPQSGDQELLRRYWDAIDADLGDIAPQVTLDPVQARSRDRFTVYAARFTGLGSYRLFGYLSVPAGDGPFPGVLEVPGYGSVNHVPHDNDRSRYIVLTPMHRGQRLSDEPFAAPYPGLLTMGIADAESYIYRSIVADCLTAAEILAAQPKLDTERVGVVGNDLALLIAARRPCFTAVRIQGFLFYRAMEARRRTAEYPLEEINDYLRDRPEDAEAVRRTLSLFDPVNHAPRVRAKTLVASADDFAPQGEPWLRPLMDALGDQTDHYRITHEGGTDNDRLDNWLADRLGVQPMSRFRRQLT